MERKKRKENRLMYDVGWMSKHWMNGNGGCCILESTSEIAQRILEEIEASDHIEGADWGCS
jgi:hypothetical protein